MGKLSLASVLEGRLSAFYSPEGQTTFTAWQTIRVPSKPKATWIETQLTKWIEAMREEGLVINDWIFERPLDKNYTHDNYTVARWDTSAEGRVSLSITLDGSISTPDLGQNWSRTISGTVKKLLAFQFMDAYPLPYDPQNPLLPAGTLDYLHIDGRTSYSASNKLVKELEDTIVQEVKALLENHGAKHVKDDCTNMFTHWHMRVLWKKDVSDAQRKALEEAIASLFSDKLGYLPKVGLWVY